MTTIGRSNSDYPVINFTTRKPANVNNTQASGEVKKVQTVDMQPSKSIDRKDLDSLSPYTGMVNFSQKPPAGSPESYAMAAPEFGRWNDGNFAISDKGKQEAVDYLSAYNTALKTYSQVAPHIQDKQSPYAKLFC